MAVSTAAVYHHFRTREELLSAVIEPVVRQLREAIEGAEAQRTRHACAEHMLTGYVDVAVRNKDLISVLAANPGVIEMLHHDTEINDLVERQIKLLADLEPGPGGLVKAGVVLAGAAGAAGRRMMLDVDDDVLRHHLVEGGRRLLGIRAPRRTPVTRP